MTQARKEVVLDGERGVYHCISRCVRRAFLCGEDAYTGRSYEHRKDWVRDRVEELSGVFGVEVFAYAVMSNHLHLVMEVRPDLVAQWSDEELARRWYRLYPKQRDKKGRAMPPPDEMIHDLCSDKERLGKVRSRLGNLSWFMRCLNEWIARRANREDECTGRFWEGRFKCQRLMDEGAVLACMAYVDLNPVRCGIAESPESSEFTSIYDRIQARQARERLQHVPEKPTDEQRELIDVAKHFEHSDKWLADFGETLPFVDMSLEQYIELIDYTGRCYKEGKSGRMSEDLLPILERLTLDTEHWVKNVQRYGKLFYRIAGQVDRIRHAASQSSQRWFRSREGSQQLYKSQQQQN